MLPFELFDPMPSPKLIMLDEFINMLKCMAALFRKWRKPVYSSIIKTPSSSWFNRRSLPMLMF